MPEICRFYGIVIKMFFDDHNPPHFHVEYENFNALIEIATLAVIAGKLPPHAIGLVMEWATLHQDQLLSMWNDAKVLKPIGKIEPLE